MRVSVEATITHNIVITTWLRNSHSHTLIMNFMYAVSLESERTSTIIVSSAIPTSGSGSANMMTPKNKDPRIVQVNGMMSSGLKKPCHKCEIQNNI